MDNSYGLKLICKYCPKFQTLIVAEDYTDTSFPFIDYKTTTILDTIVCKMATPPMLYDTFSDRQHNNMVVIVPTESLSDYQSADVWKKFWCLQGGAENYISTGISTVTIGKGNSRNAIYDLQGRKLDKLHKGINIINGKKVLVR